MFGCCCASSALILTFREFVYSAEWGEGSHCAIEVCQQPHDMNVHVCVCGNCQAVLSYRIHLDKRDICPGSVLMPPVATAFSVFLESNFLLFFLHVCTCESVCAHVFSCLCLICMCVCVNPRLMSVFLDCALPCVLEQVPPQSFLIGLV